MFDLVILQIVMGFVFIFSKQAALNSSPFFLIAIRVIPASIIFLVGTYCFDRKHFYITRALVPAVAGLGFFFFLMDAFRFVALQYIPSSHGALVNSLSPFMTALFAHVLFKEKLTGKKVLALSLGFCAVLPLIVQNILATPVLIGSKYGLLGGYIATFMGTLSAVVGSFFLKELVGVQRYSIFMSFGASLLMGGLTALVCSLIFEPWNPVPLTNVDTVLPIIGLLFIAHNLIVQPLFGYVVKKYPITLVAFATLISPLTTYVIGHYRGGQEIGNMFIVSLVTLMVSFYLFYHEEKKEGLV